MGINSREQWFITCDANGCCVSTDEDGADIAETESQVIKDAKASGFVVVCEPGAYRAKWFCEEHAPKETDHD